MPKQDTKSKKKELTFSQRAKKVQSQFDEIDKKEGKKPFNVERRRVDEVDSN